MPCPPTIPKELLEKPTIVSDPSPPIKFSYPLISTKFD